LASEFGYRNELPSDGLALSVLSSGPLDDIAIPAFVLGVALLAGTLEFLLGNRSDGNYGFDPLGLEDTAPPVISSQLPEGRKWMAEAELKNGRLAMLAITSYAVQEFFTKVPVVNETPFLFKGPF